MTSGRPFLSMLRGALLVLAFTLPLPTTTAAQDVPTVFLHGLKSNSGTWHDTARRLEAELRITPHLADTNWRDWFEHQAHQVHAVFGQLPAQSIAVGHSNGGIVARQWSKSRPFRAVVTLGTPHEGALLAQRGLDLLGFNQQLFGWANFLVAVIGGPSNEFSWMWPFMAHHLNFAAILAASTVGELAATLGIGVAAPVLGQMVPGSAFLGQLNSGHNLWREASAITDRVGMVFVAREYWRGGVAVGLKPEWQESVASSTQIAIVILDAAAAYLRNFYPPFNPTAQGLLSVVTSLSAGLRQVDPLWCWAVTNDASCATSHDGIVGTPAQFFPGGTNVGFYGPPHLWQTRESPGILRDVFTGHLRVLTRDDPAPPPAPGPGPSPGPGPNPGPGPWSLTAGQRLYPGQEIRSHDGAYSLTYQGDGNLVIYRLNGPPIWASQTHGTSAGSLQMQGDGNLVIYDASGTPVWASGTWGSPGAYASLLNDGHLVVFDASGAPIWWSGGE